ncbi:hypothetical protein Barb4_00018 [Bacteroidales bacterium Barb4]|nr:hypothetical protein Barb4_00018 [Bacteroidales bacterium Barb4]
MTKEEALESISEIELEVNSHLYSVFNGSNPISENSIDLVDNLVNYVLLSSDNDVKNKLIELKPYFVHLQSDVKKREFYLPSFYYVPQRPLQGDKEGNMEYEKDILSIRKNGGF